MKYLAINTSGENIEIGLRLDDKFIYWTDEDSHKASAILLPNIERILSENGVTIKDLDALGCVIGPGSFTGIRIGISTIKSLAYSLNKKIIAVNYLRQLAYNSLGTRCESIVSLVDGSNGMCYVAVYSPSLETEYLKPSCCSVIEAKKMIEMVEEPCSVIGDKAMADVMGRVTSFYGELCFYRAFDNEMEKKHFITYNDLTPMYIRKSQAEREKGDL